MRWAWLRGAFGALRTELKLRPYEAVLPRVTFPEAVADCGGAFGALRTELKLRPYEVLVPRVAFPKAVAGVVARMRTCG